MSKDKPNLIVKNKTASRNFILGDTFQAGLVLEGWEVKSLRNGKKIRDQRQDIKKRDWERDQGRILKNAKNNSHPSKNFK